MKFETTKVKSTATVKVVLEKEEWVAAQDKAYTKLGKDVTVPGFRKGNAPLQQVKRHVSFEKMMDKAYEEVVQKAYEQILGEQKLDVVCTPKVDVTKLTPEEFEFSLVIPCKPEFTLGEYKNIEVAKDPIEVSEEEINEQIKQIQQANATVKVKEDGAKIEKGDVVKFDFEGFVDGKAFEGGKAENYELEIGSGAFIPGFEDGMIGLEKGYKGDLHVTFPEQYAKELAGKPAVFKIKINEISTKEIPAVDDDLALDAQIEGVETVEQLKTYVKEGIAKGKENAVEEKALNVLIDKVVENSPMELPEILVEDDMDRNLESFKQNVAQRGLGWDKYLEIVNKKEEEVRESLREQTIRNLKAMFVLNEVARIEKVEVTPQDIEEEFGNIAAMYNMEVAKVKEILKDRVGDIQGQIYSRKVTDFLKNANKFVEGKKEVKKAAPKAAPKAAAKDGEAKPAAKKPAAKKTTTTKTTAKKKAE